MCQLVLRILQWINIPEIQVAILIVIKNGLQIGLFYTLQLVGTYRSSNYSFQYKNMYTDASKLGLIRFIYPVLQIRDRQEDNQAAVVRIQRLSLVHSAACCTL